MVLGYARFGPLLAPAICVERLGEDFGVRYLSFDGWSPAIMLSPIWSRLLLSCSLVTTLGDPLLEQLRLVHMLNECLTGEAGASSIAKQPRKMPPTNPMTAALIKKYKINIRTLGDLAGSITVLPEGPDDFAEVFSPPRLTPLVMKSHGASAWLSVDILLGWDLTNRRVQELLLSILKDRQVRGVMLSPPCTSYSCIQNMNPNAEPVLKKATT
jgi:hypothetical protein